MTPPKKRKPIERKSQLKSKKTPARKEAAPKTKRQMKIQLDPTSVFHMTYVNSLAHAGPVSKIRDDLQEAINRLANDVGQAYVGQIGTIVGLAAALSRETIDAG